MLFHLLSPLRTQISVLNVTRYITFRTAAASLSALAISLVLGPWLIRKLHEFQIGQVIRTEGPQTHMPKAGTPTMGGLLILTAALMPTLLWADLTNVYVWIAVLTTGAYGAIGFADDYLKIVRRSHHGLRPLYKMGWQIVCGLAVGAVLLVLAHNNLYSTRVIFPFFKRLIPDLGWLYLPFAAFVLVAVSNSVNLTDGLDGLAAGTGIIALFTYSAINVIAWIRSGPPGHRFETKLDLAIVGAALIGGLIGFLWYNAFPAEVFMGDTGSMAIGGALAAFAIFTQTTFLLLLIGGIFAIEALSVILQVFSFRYWGRRIFLMTPIHHHFEMKAWSETKIMVRFWIVTAILCAAAFALYYRYFTGFR